MNTSQYNEVLALLRDYYDGLYNLDVAKLRDVFSPGAHYATIAKGALLELTMDEYFPRVEQRTSPADEGTPYESRVVSIRFAGENTAFAEVECSMFDHDYQDFLSLLRIDGRWRVQTKVFEGVPHPTTEVR